MGLMMVCTGTKVTIIRKHPNASDNSNSLHPVNPAPCASGQLSGVECLVLYVEQPKMMHSLLALMRAQYLKRATSI